MKKLKTGLIITAFLCLGVAGFFFNMSPDRLFSVFDRQVSPRVAGLFFIMAGVVIYFAGRLLGVYLKFKKPL